MCLLLQVTITTVGYGDMIPKTTFGKIVGSILALIGLPLIAIPMPLIMTKFEKLYTTVKVRPRVFSFFISFLMPHLNIIFIDLAMPGVSF